jgi:hypothetical protein
MSYTNDAYGTQYGSSGGNAYAQAGGFIANQGPNFGGDTGTTMADSPTRKVCN